MGDLLTKCVTIGLLLVSSMGVHAAEDVLWLQVAEPILDLNTECRHLAVMAKMRVIENLRERRQFSLSLPLVPN